MSNTLNKFNIQQRQKKTGVHASKAGLPFPLIRVFRFSLYYIVSNDGFR